MSKDAMLIMRENAISELKQWQECGDIEIAHHKADRVIVTLLKDLGYSDVAEEWEKIKKWYA